jgi:SRSO17 transposase
MGIPSTAKDECEVAEADVAGLLQELQAFLDPYLPLFGRRENHGHARRYVEGRLQRLERRTLEPIANEHNVHRRPLQYFVGAGLWEDKPVRAQLCEQVAKEIGTRDGVLILDSSGLPKKGDHSVGVQRQWCGRLGKEENCQLGEFLAYASPKGHTLVDCRLYLPKSWAADRDRRRQAHVPEEVQFRKGWELAYEMVHERSSVLPHSWVVGDDSYGHPVALRERLATDGERYLLEVPSNTQVMLDDGTWQSAATVADSLPAKRWSRVRTRDGEKGPIEVDAVKLRVMTRTGSGKRTVGRRETLLITERGDERWYYLSNARGVSVAKMTKVAACRHYVEQSLELAKGDVGLDEYEVRSWVGWHHHMTLSLLACFFLILERKRLKKSPGDHGPADQVDDGALVGSQRDDASCDRTDRESAHAPAASQ